MLRTKLTSWLEGSLDKAERAFVRKSGWSERQVSSTVKKINGLDAVDRVFLGGLLVGNVLRRSPGMAAAKAASKRRTRRKRSEIRA